MFEKAFDDISREDIESRVANQVPEGRSLDYKQALPLVTGDGRRDFLSDVSAFANSAGGWLLYGIEKGREGSKTTGLPIKAHGLDCVSVDEAIKRLDSWLQDGMDPRIFGVRIRAIDGFPKGPVILVHVPKSWNAPHMIIGGSPKFYARNNGGNYPLDCAEIRAALLGSVEISERIEKFRAEQISKITSDKIPAPLGSMHRVVLHLVPFSSMVPRATIDMELAQKDAANLTPLFCSGYESTRYNFDGFVTWGWESYLQLFRNGIIESANSSLLNVIGSIPTPAFEPAIFDAVDKYLKILKLVSVPTPVVLLLTLIGVKGYTTQGAGGGASPVLDKPKGSIDRDILELPDFLIDDLSKPGDLILRPAFDMIWQACGYKACPNYDEHGRWKALRKF